MLNEGEFYKGINHFGVLVSGKKKERDCWGKIFATFWVFGHYWHYVRKHEAITQLRGCSNVQVW